MRGGDFIYVSGQVPTLAGEVVNGGIISQSEAVIENVISADVNKVGFEIFNVGDNENNFTKQMIVDEILKIYPKGRVKYLEKGFDRRNYIVDFSKVNSVLGFKPKYTIKKGVEEIIIEIKKNTFNFENKNFYGNYNLNL